MSELGRPGVWREHGLQRLLELQEQRRAQVGVGEQAQVAPGADAADPHDFPGRVEHPVALQQGPPVGWQRLRVHPDHFLAVERLRVDMADERRIVDDLQRAVGLLGQLGKDPQAGALADLGHAKLAFEVLGALLPGYGEHRGDIHPVVPDVQRPHYPKLGHPLPVGADGPADHLAGLLIADLQVPGGQDHARGQPLHVPLPGAGQRLVEVVDVEDQIPLGGAEDPEVGQVRVTANLHPQPGGGGSGQVVRHDHRGAAQERERRGEHPPVPDGH